MPTPRSGFRPNLSARGPRKSWVEAKPMKYATTTSWRWFSDATCSERPIAGSAGTIASMAKAFKAISPASITVISRAPGRFTPS